MSGEILTVLRGKGRSKAALPRGVRYADVLDLYAAMMRVRRLESEGRRRLRSGEVPFLVVGGGREALLAGVVSALGPDDALRTTQRDHGAAILRGVPMAEVFGQWLGRSIDPAGGMVSPVPLSRAMGGLLGPSGSATAHIAQAAGHAHGLRLQGSSGVVVTLLHADALDSSDAHAGFLVSVRLAAPVVFFLTAAQGGSEAVSARLRGYALPLVRVDGDDVVAVSTATRDALVRARAEEGPLAIIAETASSSTGGASPGGGADIDPIARVREFLVTRRALDAAADHEIHATIEDEACTAWKTATDAELAAPSRIFGHESDATAAVRAQDLELAARQRSRAGDVASRGSLDAGPAERLETR